MFLSIGTSMIKMVGQQAIILNVLFQELKKTQPTHNAERIIRANSLKVRKDTLGVVSLLIEQRILLLEIIKDEMMVEIIIQLQQHQ